RFQRRQGAVHPPRAASPLRMLDGVPRRQPRLVGAKLRKGFDWSEGSHPPEDDDRRIPGDRAAYHRHVARNPRVWTQPDMAAQGHDIAPHPPVDGNRAADGDHVSVYGTVNFDSPSNGRHIAPDPLARGNRYTRA